MKHLVDYDTRISELMAELRGKTLTQAEQDRHITKLDYSGVGYGYNMRASFPKTVGQARKDMETPELKKLERLIASMD
jgi:hypothetical protein